MYGAVTEAGMAARVQALDTLREAAGEAYGADAAAMAGDGEGNGGEARRRRKRTRGKQPSGGKRRDTAARAAWTREDNGGS